MSEIDLKKYDGDEEVGGGGPISNLEDNNQQLQAPRDSPTKLDLKRKLSSNEFNAQKNLEINLKNANSSERNKSDDSEPRKKIKTNECENEGAENQKETEVNGNDATGNNATGPTDLKSVVTVKEEVTDTSLIKDVKKERCDGENDEIDEEIPAPLELKSVVTVKEEVTDTSLINDISNERCDGENVEINEEIAAPLDLKTVVTVKEEVTDTSLIKDTNNERCDGENVEIDEEILAPLDLKTEVTVKEEVTDTSVIKDINNELCDGENNVERDEEIPAAGNDEANDNAAVPPDISPVITIQVVTNNGVRHELIMNGLPALPPNRPSCRFGVNCYRVNAAHLQEFAHPGDQDYRRPDYPQPPADTPMCPFMNACYRRNPMHFQEFSHPDGYDAHMAAPPQQQQPQQPPAVLLLNNMGGYAIDFNFEEFSESDSEYEPSDHEVSSDEGVSSGIDDDV